MIRRRSDSGWRATSLAAALFAITLNFLQPLAHAALMRDGGPQAAARMWGAFCLPAAGQDDADAPPPSAGKSHECCLGLAHAPVLAELSTAFVLVEHVVAAVRFVAVTDPLSPVGIRDGPSQPRAPPSFV
ncbi:MAG: hypothetical protein EPO55_23475 [Reyranella sp.]|uniref:DUF2946 family protein n=1 Tax=Reyranella sp. TaxID=1929291 RepID=UPI0011FDAFC1|nr:DUF2946 family protein [Reyranella sp.]TAJ35964.1 MAG: hypothetical protein EPO55_23475 [Reyranella sp.]